MINLFSFSLEPIQLSIVFSVAFFVGMSKTGIQGTGMLSAPLMVMVFGGHSSSGMILPMLIMGDIFGVWYYHRHADWQALKKLFPWAGLGIIIGTFVGVYINDAQFRVIMATVIVLSVIVMIFLENKPIKVPKHPMFAASTGILGGFTSMIGNLAGTVMAVYLLAMKMPKNSFIGTTAWFFLVVNVFKVPFHLFVWHTINWNGFLLNLITLPAILSGAFLGIAIVKKLSDRNYRWFIIGITLLASFMMLLK